MVYFYLGAELMCFSVCFPSSSLVFLLYFPVVLPVFLLIFCWPWFSFVFLHFSSVLLAFPMVFIHVLSFFISVPFIGTPSFFLAYMVPGAHRDYNVSSCMFSCHFITYLPHKAVAEVSKDKEPIGKGWAEFKWFESQLMSAESQMIWLSIDVCFKWFWLSVDSNFK